MRKHVVPVRAFAFLLAISLVWLPALAAPPELRIPAAALVSEADLQQVFQVGQQFEQQRRWGEALTHYEQALKTYPGTTEIEQRLTLARIHYDLGRRYSDGSFLRSLTTTSESEALEVYTEVLLKIQSHYVDSPDWNDLVRRGTSNIDVALGESNFLQQNLPNADPQRLQAARSELHRQLDSRPARSRQEARDLVAYAARVVAQQTGIGPQVIVMEYICGATGALDIYSSFLTRDQYDDVMSQIEGNFVGLGIELKAQDDALLIVSVISGGPADQGGIRAGDRIVEVNGQTTKDLTTDKAADMLKGVEGSTVDLTVVTPQTVSRKLRLRRERVEIPSVEKVRIIDPDFSIGYLKLTSFQKTTLRDFDAALWNLHHQGMKSLIVDVRGNPGGLLNASVDIADRFVSSGTIVSTRGRNPREDFDHTAHSFGTWRVPLIVLIDGDSASASEIFAGAIHDNRRGTVVGQQSYGKGSVQGIFPLQAGRGGVRLTTAKFYSPNGTPISHRGVSPDIVVRTTAKPVDGALNEQEDAVLKAGLQVARQQLSQR